MLSSSTCPHCGAPRTPTAVTCARCGKPLGDDVGLPTAMMPSPNAEPAGLPTAMMPSPNAEPAGLPTAMMPSPTHEAPPAPTQLHQAPMGDAPPAPTQLVQSPNHERGAVPTTRVAAPFAEPPKARSSAPRLGAPGGHERTGKTTNARPRTQSKPETVDTAREQAPFPVETREAPKVKPDTHDDAVNDTGRVVAPYRNANDAADTGKVAVPFRAVEAPFAVEDDGSPETPSKPSVPMAVAKKPGATQTFDDEVEVAQAVPAMFPVGEEPGPSGPQAQVVRTKPETDHKVLIIAAVLISLLTGTAVVLLLTRKTAEAVANEALIHDVSAKFKVRPGFLRVDTLCGGKQTPARLTIDGVDKGPTPVEVALPTALPAGENILELHLSRPFGDAVDARYPFELPLVLAKPGAAIEVDLPGCAPQQYSK